MLRKLFALTEQGAKDLKKGIIASVFASLSLMLPMGLLLMLVMQLLQPLLGIDAAAPSLGTYTGMVPDPTGNNFLDTLYPVPLYLYCGLCRKCPTKDRPGRKITHPAAVFLWQAGPFRPDHDHDERL